VGEIVQALDRGDHFVSASCVYDGGVENLNNMLPIIPHESAGVDCCGCIVVVVRDSDAELVCNECGAVVGVVQVGILRDLVSLIPDVPER
jgi:hypothetical protein